MKASPNTTKTPHKNRKPITTVRTTVSLARLIWDFAEQNMQEGGFNGNFSAYVAALIREDAKQRRKK